MKPILTLLTLLLLGGSIKAQKTDSLNKKGSSAEDSLMNALTGPADKKQPVIATFKASRLILSQTTETVKKHNLNFLVIHRFGDIGGAVGGGKTLWGFDDSSDIYIGFEYGITDNLDIDFGRSKFNQLLDLQLKYAVIHQTADDSAPFALTILGKTALRPYEDAGHTFNVYSDRVSYFAQAIFARKFSPRFSMQISPSFVRDNSPFPFIAGNERGFFALGGAARLKVTKRMGIVVDYVHPFSTFRQNYIDSFYDPLGFGIEIETGGHVFTINFSNAKAISEINYLSDTQSSYAKGQFRLGFTISRIFDLAPNHKSSDNQ